MTNLEMSMVMLTTKAIRTFYETCKLGLDQAWLYYRNAIERYIEPYPLVKRENAGIHQPPQ